MRQILFRGKRLCGNWVFGGFVELIDHYDQNKRKCVIIDQDLEDHDEWEIDPQTVGQFTGLYDKNGKEIYEGDIVRYLISWNEYAVNYWDEGWACYVLTGKNGTGYHATLADYDTKNLEVIGNIHD